MTTLADQYRPSPSVLRNRKRSNATHLSRKALRQKHPIIYKRINDAVKEQHRGDYRYIFNESYRQLVAMFPREYNELRHKELEKLGVR